jgi:hypothetical protein
VPPNFASVHIYGFPSQAFHLIVAFLPIFETMASILRYSAVAAMATLAFAHGELPSQTIGIGQPLFELMPTKAPSLDLIKRSLGKRALTNTCSEWTILDGGGFTPICLSSQTCLFTSATDGYGYEGCGQTSIAYNWITTCYDYNSTQTGLPPVSQIYASSTLSIFYPRALFVFG